MTRESMKRTALKRAAQKQRDGEAAALIKFVKGIAADLRAGRIFAMDITYRKKRRSRPHKGAGRVFDSKIVFDSPGAL